MSLEILGKILGKIGYWTFIVCVSAMIVAGGLMTTVHLLSKLLEWLEKKL
jgi:hypothetical protein